MPSDPLPTASRMQASSSSSSAHPPSPRPPFLPTPLLPQCSILRPLPPSNHYLPLLSAPAPFPLPSFSHCLTNLLLHPEYSGPLILRSEPLPPPVPPIPASTPQFSAWRPTEVTRRKLLPRVPERDKPLVQTCVRYRPSAVGEAGEGELLLLIPELGEGEKVPYYHPEVERLALVYTSVEGGGAETQTCETGSEAGTAEGAYKVHGEIRVEVVLPPSASPSPSPIDPSSRLYRTCLHLLETVHKHSLGHLHHYQKRVTHDLLVPKAEYQDLYLKLKQRHRGWVGQWPLGTDARKHVFEDVAIAAFLMLLWKGDYPALEEPSRPLPQPEPSVRPASSALAGDTGGKGLSGTNALAEKEKEKEEREERCEWASWGRPPGGFVDLGCGNGLLVHVLLQEGYTGYGVDLTARKTWPSFPLSTQAQLHTSPISPLQDPPVQPPLPAGAFLIGNHPDELTPYVPLLATLYDASGWLVIPCCPFTYTSRFTAPHFTSKLPHSEVERRLAEGGEGGGRVKAYLAWVEEQGRWGGWEVGVEALRMPSTRNWGLVGRRRAGGEVERRMGELSLTGGADGGGRHGGRIEEHGEREEQPLVVTQEDGLRWAQEKLEEIRRGGGFKVRQGKGHH